MGYISVHIVHISPHIVDLQILENDRDYFKTKFDFLVKHGWAT